MSVYSELIKRKTGYMGPDDVLLDQQSYAAGGGGNAEQQLPEQQFEDGVKEVVAAYMGAKFPYVTGKDGFYRIEELDLPENSAILSYNITNDGGETIGSVPILFAQGKMIEPWCIHVTEEERLIPLTEDWMDKLMEVAQDFGGSIPEFQDGAPGRVLWETQGDAPYGALVDAPRKAGNWRTADLTPKSAEVLLGRLSLQKLVSVIKKAHVDGSFYFDIGRVATKVASGKLLSPKRRFKTKETVTLKKGCLYIDKVEDLGRLKVASGKKSAALSGFYSGEPGTYVFGDEVMGDFADTTDLVEHTDKRFEVMNLYMDVLAKPRPVIPGIDKETGEEIFLVKTGRLTASDAVSSDFTLRKRGPKDTIEQHWNKPEHVMSSVAEEGWETRYIDRMKENAVKDDALQKAVTELITTGNVVSADKLENGYYLAVPLDPTEPGGTGYGIAVLFKKYATSDKPKKHFFDWECSQNLYRSGLRESFIGDMKKMEDGIMRSRYGEEYVFLFIPDEEGITDESKPFMDKYGIFTASPDAVFSTQASGDVSHTVAGCEFPKRVLSLDDAARTTLWVKKESEAELRIGMSYRDGDMTNHKNLGRFSKKAAGFVLGMCGSTEPGKALEKAASGWRQFVTSVGPDKVTKIAEMPLDNILGDLIGQASAVEEGGGKISINIENLNISSPDIAGRVKGTSESGKSSEQDGAGEGSGTESELKLKQYGASDQLIADLKDLAGVIGESPEMVFSDAVMFVDEGVSQGASEEDMLAQLEQQTVAMLQQGAPMEGAPMEGAPMGGAPMEGAPMEGAPMEGAPMEGAPMGGAPMGGTPMGGTVPMAGGVPDPSQMNPDQVMEILMQMGITEPTIQLLLQTAPLLGVSETDVLIEAGAYAEELMAQGVPAQQIDSELYAEAQQMLAGGSPEMANVSGMPGDAMTQQVPMDPQQEQMMMEAGQGVTGAMPGVQPMETPMYDQVSAMQPPPVPGADQSMGIARRGSLIADIIGNATIKSKFLDYLPVLHNAINSISELILKIELSRNKLINEVGVENLDKVSGELREVNKRLGTLVLDIAAFD